MEKWERNLEDCEKRPTFAVAFEEGAAQVAELVDALVSGTSNSNVVQVRFLSWARFVFRCLVLFAQVVELVDTPA